MLPLSSRIPRKWLCHAEEYLRLDTPSQWPTPKKLSLRICLKVLHNPCLQAKSLLKSNQHTLYKPNESFPEYEVLCWVRKSKLTLQAYIANIFLYIQREGDAGYCSIVYSSSIIYIACNLLALQKGSMPRTALNQWDCWGFQSLQPSKCVFVFFFLSSPCLLCLCLGNYEGNFCIAGKYELFKPSQLQKCS